jgi:hypothetical protein
MSKCIVDPDDYPEGMNLRELALEPMRVAYLVDSMPQSGEPEAPAFPRNVDDAISPSSKEHDHGNA